MMQSKKPVRRAFTGRLVGLPPEPLSTPVTKAVGGAVASEDEVRREFGIGDKKAKPKLPDSYRQTLNLDPQDIIGFFDVKVGESEEFTEVDFVVPPPMLEHRIRRLQKIIARSKEIVEGLSVHKMKLHRAPDDPLRDDKATREKFKRKENARIARSNKDLFTYRAALRSGNFHQKVWRTVTKPVYFRDVVDDEMRFETVIDTKYIEGKPVFTGGLHTHNLTELVEYFRVGFLDLEGYRTIMKLDSDALDELGETDEERQRAWQILKRWENAVIRAAVFHGIIKPRRDLAELLGFGAILDEDDHVILADSTEDKLAIKTRGACYGGRIKSEGYRYRNGNITQRSLSDFDKPLKPIKNVDGGYEDAGLGSLYHLNDDTESYDPR
jgi:hypothetical protein